jgi:hypothetical protein
VAIVAGLIGLGWWPTARWGGSAALTSMVVGCAIGLIAAGVGTLPIVLGRGKKAADTIPAVMGSIAARLMTAVFLGVLAASVDELASTPLILWLVISHAGLLAADIQFARRVLYIG